MPSGKVHNKTGDGGMVQIVDVGGMSKDVAYEEAEMRKEVPVLLAGGKYEGSVNNMNVPPERD